MSYFKIILCVSMIFISSSFSREPVPPANLLQCGFEVTNYIHDKMTQLFGAFAELTASRYRNTRTIGVIFYVTSDNMTWNLAAVSRADIEAAMGRLNSHWSGLNIKFQICDTKLIEQTYHRTDFKESESATEIEMGRRYHVSNLINVFIVQTSRTSWANFPVVGNNDWILMNAAQFLNQSSFSHEMGHYFGLLHTHDSAFGHESMSGANCAVSGDLVCDTPADPGLEALVDPTTCQPVKNLGFKPLTDNLMCYAPPSCRSKLSTGQRRQIMYFATRFRRSKRACR